MAIENIKIWLKSENPLSYDFVEDTLCEKQKASYRGNDTYQKFFLYRVDTARIKATLNRADVLMPDYADSFIKFVQKSMDLSLKDPDNCSKLLQEIYEVLWPSMSKEHFMRNRVNWIASDTMASVQYSLTAATALEKYKKNGDFLKIYIKEKINGTLPWNNSKPGVTKNVGIDLASNEDTTHFCEQLKEDYPHLENFIASYHTLGNYCPVATGSNGPRGLGKSNDYWDLAMIAIYKWYTENDDAYVNDMLQGNKEVVYTYKKWLEFFGKGIDGWYNFVDTLFMQDYVYTEKDEEVQNHEKLYYEPKPLWEGHNWENITLPIDKCDEFFETVTDRILNRGKRMIEALKKIIQGEQ